LVFLKVTVHASNPALDDWRSLFFNFYFIIVIIFNQAFALAMFLTQQMW